MRKQSRRIRVGPARTPLQSNSIFIKKRRKNATQGACLLKTAEGVSAVKKRKFVSHDKKEIVELPSVFDLGRVVELTDKNEFLGPMNGRSSNRHDQKEPADKSAERGG